MKTRLQDRFTRVDLAALLAFVAVWIFYGVMVRYSAYVADECAYISIAERFVLGDRPIVDEWNLAQMSCLILCLPYKLFVAVTGGTAGVVLFLRYVFLAFNAAFFWFVYIRLRAYKWVGLIAALLFSIYVPLGLFSCNFYTVAIRFVMIACLILFSEKQKLPSLILAGVLLAWSALFQPGFALLYFIYTALAWIRFFRQKKSKPFLDDVSFCFTMRAWIGITLGVLLSAAAVLIWLIASCGVQSIIASVPMLFTEPAFDVSADGNVKGFFLRKIVSAAQIYTPVCWIPALVILALSIAYACGKFGARRDNMRKVLFGMGCVIWLLSCILPLCQAGRLHLELLFTMYPMPMFWFGFVCCLLGDKSSKRLLFFWVAALLSSLCVDFISSITLSLGSPIAYIADLVFFTDLVRQLRTDRADAKVKNVAQLRSRQKAERSDRAVRVLSKATCAGFAAWFAFTLLFWNTFFPAHLVMSDPLFSFPVLCEDGPCRGIHYPENYGKYYAAKLADIDTLKEKHPKNLYVCGAAPELYLYAQLPYATYSSSTYRNTLALIQRHVQYWKMYPDRLPACIYVPFDNAYNSGSSNESETQAMIARIREAFDPLCEYTSEMGQSGYILYVSRWTLDAGSTQE